MHHSENKLAIKLSQNYAKKKPLKCIGFIIFASKMQQCKYLGLSGTAM